MKAFTSFAVGVASLATSVAAHGYVQSMLINGQEYPGFLPFTDLYTGDGDTKITRHIPDDGPVTDFTSTDVMCNVGAQDAEWRTTHTAEVDAGSDMSLSWVRWPSDHLGPVTTYMASCGSSCTNFDGTGAVWFKIDELGLVSGDTSTGVWASLLLIKNNLTWTVTIPPTLAPGNYLLRHEILALHSAGAPQFYPSCAQLVVKGSGTATPATSELVAIPGIYSSDTSTKIDIWTDPATSYPIAGPPVTKLQSYSTTNAKNLGGATVSDSNPPPAPAAAPSGNSTSTGSSGSGSGDTDTGGSDPSTSDTGSTSDDQTGTTAPAKSGTSGQCRLRKRAPGSRKRHVSAMKRAVMSNEIP